MSVINVTVTNAGAANVSVSSGSTVNATVGNGGAVNVSTGTISSGNATVVSGTLTINSTTTLAAGQSAYVVNNGTAYAAKLDIGIPAGPATLVSVGNTTTLASGSNATVSGVTSGSNLTLSFGIPSGANGVTPAFAIGNVTTGAAGSTASVVATTTNSGANVTLDLTIPRGDPGTSGSNGTNGTVISLSDGTPASLGTAAPGTSSLAARADHVHQMPQYSSLLNIPTNFPTNTTLVSGLSAGYSGINHAHNYVTTLNNLTGALTLAAGSNVTLTANGSTLTLSSIGGGIGLNDAVDGGEYVGEILLGITFGTQPQSQTLNSSTTVNLSTINVTVSNAAVGGYLYGFASVGNTLFSGAVRSGSAFGTSGALMSSVDDGLNWQKVSDLDTSYGAVLSSVATNGTSWLFSLGQQLFRSTSETLGQAQSVRHAYSVAWNGVRYVLASIRPTNPSGGGVGLFSSSDGLSWTWRDDWWTSTPSASESLWAIHAIGNTFVYRFNDRLLTSNDGISWNNVLSPASNGHSSACDGLRIVAANASVTNVVLRTTNGTTWTTHTLPVACNRVSYAAGRFWAFNDSNDAQDVCYSVDGISWTLAELPQLRRWYGAVASSANVLIYDRNHVVTSDSVPGTFARATIGTTSASANLTVSASSSGGAAVSYQWQVSTDAGTTWSNVSGATSSTLSLTGLTSADSGKRYRVSVSATGATTVTSQAAILTVT